MMVMECSRWDTEEEVRRRSLVDIFIWMKCALQNPSARRSSWFKRCSSLCLVPTLFSLCWKSITEPPHSGVFQPECLLLLKRPLREPVTHCRECVLGLGSRPLSLLCSLCRSGFRYSVRTARSAFHLLFASSCHKLTVDVHTWPALGHSASWIDGCSTGGVGRCWQPVTADLRLACCPRVEGPVWGDLLSGCCSALCSYILWVVTGWSGLSTGQWATTVSPDIRLCCKFHAAASWL